MSETYSSDPDALAKGARRKPRREHFWLCDACSAQFTLRFDSEMGIMTVPLGDYTGPQFLIRSVGRRAAAKAAC